MIEEMAINSFLKNHPIVTESFNQFVKYKWCRKTLNCELVKWKYTLGLLKIERITSEATRMLPTINFSICCYFKLFRKW